MASFMQLGFLKTNNERYLQKILPNGLLCWERIPKDPI
jgi:hypothetical protein